MNMRKRLTAILLVLCLCAALPGAVRADDAYPEGTVVIRFESGVPSAASSEGWTFDGATLTLDNGYRFAVEGECSVAVVCNGTIEGGRFRGPFTLGRYGTANGGVFYGEFTAKWGATINDAEFPLYFVRGGAEWADGVTAPETYHYKGSCPLPDGSALTGGSGRFDGWYTSHDFAGEPLTAVPAKTTGALYLYARFVDGPATWPEAGALAAEGTDYALDAAGNCTIYTARGLAWLANRVNGGDSFSGRTVTLANDIDLMDGGVYGYGASTVISRNSWVPIDGFGGTFDGGGCKISNLYLSVSNKDAGLFGENSGTIRGLEIASGRVSLDRVSKSALHAGGIAAVSYGLIENCVNRADIYVTGGGITIGTSNLYLGGIAGFVRNDGTKNVSTVSGCTNYGSIGSPGGSLTCSVSAGGIVGHLFSGRMRGNSALLTGCVNRGEVDVPSTGSAWAGGIAGVVQGVDTTCPATLENCENSGSVAGSYIAGGIAGFVNGSGPSGVAIVRNSYNTGTVLGGETAGGVAGMLSYSNALVENCYSRGSVTGGTNVGGCVGLASYGTMRSCYSGAEPCGTVKNGAAVTDCVRFTSAAGVHTLESGTELLTALRDWVAAQGSSALWDWMADTANENYPVFARSYRVTYHANGGTIENESSYTQYVRGTGLTLPVPTRADYAFEGWYESADFSTPAVTEIGPTDTGDRVFYAKWRYDAPPVVYHTLRFETDGGSAVRSVRRAAGSRIRLDQTTERPGYVFTGWYLDEGRTQRADQVVLRRDMTVYAGWRRDVADPGDTGVSDRLNTAEHIKYLEGYSNGEFGADNDMTRAEAAQMFYRLLLDKNVPVTVRFDDVREGAWYAGAVEALASMGIVKGVGGGRFAPERSITRAEFTAMAMRFAHLDTGGENIFADVAEGAWYYGAVVGSVKYGWITGYPDGNFGPDNTITRAEAAAVVNRMLGRSGDDSYLRAHGGSLTRFPDLAEGHWAYRDIMEAVNAHEFTIINGTEHWK